MNNMAFKKVKRVEWDKTYVVNRGTDQEDTVVCGLIGSVDEFKADYERNFKREALTVELEYEPDTEE